jgi:hypothetical protein
MQEEQEEKPKPKEIKYNATKRIKEAKERAIRREAGLPPKEKSIKVSY